MGWHDLLEATRRQADKWFDLPNEFIPDEVKAEVADMFKRISDLVGEPRSNQVYNEIIKLNERIYEHYDTYNTKMFCLDATLKLRGITTKRAREASAEAEAEAEKRRAKK